MSRSFRTKKDLVNLKVLQQTKQVQKRKCQTVFVKVGHVLKNKCRF